MAAKRTLSTWVSSLLLVTLLVGCSAGQQSQPANSTPTQAPAQNQSSTQNQAPAANNQSATQIVDTSKFKKNPPYKVHYAHYWTGHPWSAAQVEDVKMEFAQYKDVQLTISDGQNKKEKLLADIEDAISKKPDLLIITSSDADSPRDVTKRAIAAGIPVLSLQKVLTGDVTVKVMGDDVDIAREQTKSLVKALTEKFGAPKGNVAILAGIQGASNTNDRYTGYKEILSKYPEIKIVADQPADFRRDKGRSVMENWLQGSTKIDAVVAMADEMAIGAALAIRDANKVGQYILIAGNAQTEALERVKSGEIYSSYQVPDAAAAGVAVAMKILRGEPVPYLTIVPGEMVDKSNVAQAYNPKCFVYRGSEHAKKTTDPNGC